MMNQDYNTEQADTARARSKDKEEKQKNTISRGKATKSRKNRWRKGKNQKKKDRKKKGKKRVYQRRPPSRYPLLAAEGLAAMADCCIKQMNEFNKKDHSMCVYKNRKSRSETKHMPGIFQVCQL